MAGHHRSTVLIGAVATLIVFSFPGALAFAQAPAAAPQTPPAATPQAPPAPTIKLSAAQLEKIGGWIAGQGRDIAVTPIVTEILGLTKGDESIVCRAFAAEGGDEVHQIYLLPGGKGYLEAHFYKNKLDIYLADKDFALKAAVEGVHGQVPAAVTFADAQYGFSFETAWWAKYTDAH